MHFFIRALKSNCKGLAKLFNIFGYYHGTYAFQSKSTLYNYLNFKELLARNRCNRRVTRQEEGGGLPCPFSKIGKKCPNFGEKMPWLCPSCVKFLILNLVLRVSRAFLACVVDEMFIDVPWFLENSPALKDSWLHACAISKF